MRRKNGFTLIELLAIIVILAIIAVITIPIILNIIDNSKRGAVKDSAYGYKDSINKFYVAKLVDDPNYSIPDGTYTLVDLDTLGVSVSGDKPDSNSWVYIKKNSVFSACLQFDEYKVDIVDGVVGNAIKEECDEAPVVFNGTYEAPTNTDTHLGIVYLDPTDLSTVCSSTVGYSDSQSVPGVKTGCMKFYVFDENDDGTVDMILDHNTTRETVYANTQDRYGYNNYHGPREALYQLYEDTKDWNGISALTSASNYVRTSYSIDYTHHLQNSYSFTYVDGAHKARFITAEEVALITGQIDWSPFLINSFYFDSNYYWLVDNLYDNQVGGVSQDIKDVNDVGYWTASTSPYQHQSVWYVRVSALYYQMYAKASDNGIRPVITVSKSVLGIE